MQASAGSRGGLEAAGGGRAFTSEKRAPPRPGVAAPAPAPAPAPGPGHGPGPLPAGGAARARDPRDLMMDDLNREKAKNQMRRLRANHTEVVAELRRTNESLLLRTRHLEAQVVALAAENQQFRARLGVPGGWNFLGPAQRSQATPPTTAAAAPPAGGAGAPPAHAASQLQLQQHAALFREQQLKGTSTITGLPPAGTPVSAAPTLPLSGGPTPAVSTAAGGKRAASPGSPGGEGAASAGKRARQLAGVLAAGLAMIGCASVFAPGLLAGPGQPSAAAPPGRALRSCVGGGGDGGGSSSTALVALPAPGDAGAASPAPTPPAGALTDGKTFWLLDYDPGAEDGLGLSGRAREALDQAVCAAPLLLPGPWVSLDQFLGRREVMARGVGDHPWLRREGDDSHALVPLGWDESDLVDAADLG